MVLSDRQIVYGYFKKLPLELHRYVYTYLTPEVMVYKWLKDDTIINNIIKICNIQKGTGANILHNIYSIHNRHKSQRLLWRHAVLPMKKCIIFNGKYISETNINYKLFAKELYSQLVESYIRLPGSYTLYTVLSLIKFISDNCCL